MKFIFPDTSVVFIYLMQLVQRRRVKTQLRRVQGGYTRNQFRPNFSRENWWSTKSVLHVWVFWCFTAVWLYAPECKSYLNTSTKSILLYEKGEVFWKTFLKSRGISEKHEQFKHLCSGHACALCMHKIPCVNSERDGLLFLFKVIFLTFWPSQNVKRCCHFLMSKKRY